MNLVHRPAVDHRETSPHRTPSRSRRALSLVAIALAAAGLVPGCSGDDSAPVISDAPDGGIVTAGDAGGDGSSAVDGSDLDGDVGDALGDGSGGDPYCAAAAAYEDRCAITGACAAARLAQCPQADQVLSDAFRAAYADCASMEPCPAADGGDADAGGGGGGRKNYTQCLTTHIGPLTDAQKKLATAYCARCDGRDAGACEADFYKTFANLYGVNDALVTSITTTCAGPDAGAADAGRADGGALECPKEFDKCARDVVNKASPPRPPECAADGG